MHVPSIRQSATVGIAFCAIVAVAAPVATPVDLGADAVDIVKRAPEPVPNNVDNIPPFNGFIVTRDELEKRRDRNNKCRRDKGRGRKNCNYDDYENYRGKGDHVQDQPNEADHEDNDLNKRDGGGDGDNQNNGAWDDMLNMGGYGGGRGGKGGGGGGGGGWGGGGGGRGGCKGGKKCGGGWGDDWNDDRRGGRKGGKKGPWRGDENPENVDD